MQLPYLRVGAAPSLITFGLDLALYESSSHFFGDALAVASSKRTSPIEFTSLGHGTSLAFAPSHCYRHMAARKRLFAATQPNIDWVITIVQNTYYLV